MEGARMGSVRRQTCPEQDFGFEQARLWIHYRNGVTFHSNIGFTDSQVALPRLQQYIALCPVFSAILGGSQDPARGLDLLAGSSFYHPGRFLCL